MVEVKHAAACTPHLIEKSSQITTERGDDEDYEHRIARGGRLAMSMKILVVFRLH